MPLETCNDKTAMEKIKANYLENYIFNIWDFVIFHTSVKQLSTRDKRKLRSIWMKENTLTPFSSVYEETKPSGFTLSTCFNATEIKVKGTTNCKLAKVWTKKVPLISLIFDTCSVTRNYLHGGRKGKYGPILTCYENENSDYHTCSEKEYKKLKKSQTTRNFNLYSFDHDMDTLSVPLSKA